MRIIWTERFNKSIEYIFTCASDFYPKSLLKRLNNAIKAHEKMLVQNPMLGTKEPLLYNRELEYRHIVLMPRFKIIYTIYDDCIYIIDIWDTRRNSKNQIRNLQ